MYNLIKIVSLLFLVFLAPPTMARNSQVKHFSSGGNVVWFTDGSDIFINNGFGSVSAGTADGTIDHFSAGKRVLWFTVGRRIFYNSGDGPVSAGTASGDIDHFSAGDRVLWFTVGKRIFYNTGFRGSGPVSAGTASGSLRPCSPDGKRIRVYGAEKSIADAFKYRNKIGLDVALEALRTWRSRRRSKIEQLLEYARVCRVERILRPYLEAMS